MFPVHTLFRCIAFTKVIALSMVHVHVMTRHYDTHNISDESIESCESIALDLSSGLVNREKFQGHSVQLTLINTICGVHIM